MLVSVYTQNEDVRLSQQYLSRVSEVILIYHIYNFAARHKDDVERDEDKETISFVE